MTFAEKLRELRDAQSLSEAKLAEASGVSFGALHDYGLGRRKPSLAAAVKITRALGTTCEAFADCEDIAGEEEQPDRKALGKAQGSTGPGRVKRPGRARKDN